ncbi:MAG: type VI secretion system lipoprotein TssJ [Pseudomonadota bacterium]
MSWASKVLAAGVLLAVAACGGDEPPPPTTVGLTVTGGADMNGGAPAKVKVYYLSSTSAFVAADFFALFDQPEATLGPALIGIDEYLLTPGAAVNDAKTFPAAPPAAIGTVAAFRSVDQPGWRATKAIAPNAENLIAVTIDGQTVTIGP